MVLQSYDFFSLLDIGCGWGTLVAYAAKNFGCDATGVTLAKNQTQFGTERIAKNGVSSNKRLPPCVLIIPDRCLLTVPVLCAAIIVRSLLALHTPRSSVWKWLRLVRLSAGYAAGN